MQSESSPHVFCNKNYLKHLGRGGEEEGRGGREGGGGTTDHTWATIDLLLAETEPVLIWVTIDNLVQANRQNMKTPTIDKTTQP